MSLGLGTTLSKGGLATPSIVTDSLVLKHNYAAGGVVPVSDGAVLLNGTSDYINCGNDSSLQIGQADITYTAWIKSTGSAEYIIAKRDDNNGAGSVHIYSGGQIRLYSGKQSQDNSSIVVNDGLWHHIAVVYDHSESDVFYYIDGMAQGHDTSVTWTAFDDNSELYIGFRESGDPGHHFTGYMCNVGIWSGTLTQPQVKSIMWKNYAGLTSSETTNLVSWWNLDEETATDGTAGSGGVKDSHGSNHGDLE